MHYIFYLLITIFLVISIIKNDGNLRRDELCKEGLFLQMFFKKCTLRDFLLEKHNNKDV